MGWKPALNAFAITFADRFPAAETYWHSAGNTVYEIEPEGLQLQRATRWVGSCGRLD
jgi:hypothetical protein